MFSSRIKQNSFRDENNNFKIKRFAKIVATDPPVFTLANHPHTFASFLPLYVENMRTGRSQGTPTA